jgi:cytochrome P450
MTQSTTLQERRRFALSHCGSVPTATVGETLAVIFELIVPTLSKGVILRRPKVVGLAESLDLDRRAIRRLQQLRNKYGDGPLMLKVPIRSQTLILSPEHVHRVLNGTPEPFTPASMEKRAALGHFEPKMSLVSKGPERTERRRFNELVLESDNPLHSLSACFASIARQEGQTLMAKAQRRGELNWSDFEQHWFRMVRRVVFGAPAADDHELSSMMARLRAAGNWAFLRPRRLLLRQQFLQRVRHYLALAAPGSLASVIASLPKSETTAPEHQVPQYLFAFDPAGMATFRALALLAAHPQQAAQAQDEIKQSGASVSVLPMLRASVLESLRLWPTTPLVLRETTREVAFETGTLPAGTPIAIFAPFFHRDDQRLPYADRFAPELWLDGGVKGEWPPAAADNWPLIPFSGGPGICPGRNFVLLQTSTMLAAILEDRLVRMIPANRLDANQRLPATLDNYTLRFEFKPFA